MLFWFFVFEKWIFREFEYKDLDEGIKSDNFGFIFKKKILLSIVCFLMIFYIM